MPQVGRNDPCPCGSGKKFKNCHMRQSRVQASRQVSQNAIEMALFRDLTQFVAQPRYAQDIAEGMAIFWGGRYSGEALGAMDTDDGRRFVEWFIHDYRYGSDRQYLIDLFIEKEGQKYPEEARNLLDAWSASAMAMLRHVRRISDDRLQVYDPLRETEYEVVSRLLATNARPGDLLVGRLYELAGTKRLTVATLILPNEYEQPMADYVRNAYRLYFDDHPDTAWDHFLRQHGHIMNVYMLSDRAQGLRGLIGAGTRFYDPAATRDRMREIERTHRQESAREPAGQGSRDPRRNIRQTASGIVLPGAEEPREEPAAQDEPPRRPTILIPGRDD
jgi:hypothetical protein